MPGRELPEETTGVDDSRAITVPESGRAATLGAHLIPAAGGRRPEDGKS
jgi:hypothetical protein